MRERLPQEPFAKVPISGDLALDLDALAAQREEPNSAQAQGQQRQHSRLRHAGGGSWVVAFTVGVVIARPGQRSWTSAHALDPQVVSAEAGRLHMTAAAVAMVAIPAIRVILFIVQPSNDLS